MTFKRKQLLTLCLIQNGSHILLGYKKRGPGKGKWNGFGGKVKAGETIEDACCREVKEEIGVDVKELTKVGLLEFMFQNDPVKYECHVFRASDYEGEPTESDEMKPKWFNVSE